MSDRGKGWAPAYPIPSRSWIPGARQPRTELWSLVCCCTRSCVETGVNGGSWRDLARRSRPPAKTPGALALGAAGERGDRGPLRPTGPNGSRPAAPGVRLGTAAASGAPRRRAADPPNRRDRSRRSCRRTRSRPRRPPDHELRRTRSGATGPDVPLVFSRPRADPAAEPLAPVSAGAPRGVLQLLGVLAVGVCRDARRTRVAEPAGARDDEVPPPSPPEPSPRNPKGGRRRSGRTRDPGWWRGTRHALDAPCTVRREPLSHRAPRSASRPVVPARGRPGLRCAKRWLDNPAADLSQPVPADDNGSVLPGETVWCAEQVSPGPQRALTRGGAPRGMPAPRSRAKQRERISGQWVGNGGWAMTRCSRVSGGGGAWIRDAEGTSGGRRQGRPSSAEECDDADRCGSGGARAMLRSDVDEDCAALTATSTTRLRRSRCADLDEDGAVPRGKPVRAVSHGAGGSRTLGLRRTRTRSTLRPPDRTGGCGPLPVAELATSERVGEQGSPPS